MYKKAVNWILKECGEDLPDKIHSLVVDITIAVPRDCKRQNITPIFKGERKIHLIIDQCP